MTGAYYNEIEPYAAQWLRNLIAAGHIAPGDVDERSIEDVTSDDLKPYTQCHFFAGIGVWSYAFRLAGWPDERPVWTGSCPCQPFSAAGKGGGFADERHLWPAFHHLISQCRPPTVFGEQVASKDGLNWLDLVHADLEGSGYAAAAVDLCAAGVGAPHIRQRLWWVADHINTRLEGRLSGRPDQGREDQHRRAGRDGAVGGLADADEKQWRRRSDSEGLLSHRPPVGRVEGDGERQPDCAVGELGDPESGGRGIRRDAVVTQQSGHPDSTSDTPDGLADADSIANQQLGPAGVPTAQGAEPERRDNGHSGPSDAGELADAVRNGTQYGAGEGLGAQATPDSRDGELSGERLRFGFEGSPDGLADADGGQLGHGHVQPGGQFGLHKEDGGIGGSRDSGPRAEADELDRGGWPGPTNSFWRDADWLYCRDGKWRPVEPGTFPLAHGTIARVGRLRAYGNAIVPQVAAEVIAAFMGATDNLKGEKE